MALVIPPRLAKTCASEPAGPAWLRALPGLVERMTHRWSLRVGAPFDGDDVSCSWVAPAVRDDGTPAVLKLGLPHMEAKHEIHGLRFWSGDPTVRLLESNVEHQAMLLERCEPGHSLRRRPEPEQDRILAGLLRRLWRRPSPPFPFRPLANMTAYWSDPPPARPEPWVDEGLVREGLRLFESLPRSAETRVLLATDLHAGNVLAARREPWLVIDPKPFMGDPAYDATQHLLNCPSRLATAPHATLDRFADLLEVDRLRVRQWMFARVVIDAEDEAAMDLARTLAP